MEKVAASLRQAHTDGKRSVVGRVIELKGFSTLPLDEMVVIDEDGTQHGDLLGRPGAEKLGAAARTLFGQPPRLETVGVSIHGPDIKELGLSCGGQADVLLQPAAAIPEMFWAALADRAPVALVTVIDGPAAAPEALAVERNGRTGGGLAEAVAPRVRESLVDEAVSMLGEGRTASRRVETESGVALVEAWVPTPRLVVVGRGDVLGALDAQAGLLGWEMRGTEGSGSTGELEALLDWAGASAALIVLSHDPHVDAPALAAGLGRAIPYIGAMGSRATQSRRIERLVALGISDIELERIHRPIGLNLGGRRAPEVALAIVAEILAVRCGRDARSLSQTGGPIHG